MRIGEERHCDREDWCPDCTLERKGAEFEHDLVSGRHRLTY